MNNSPQRDEIPAPEADTRDAEYTHLLLAFGPADHEYESEGSDDADSYILGYN